MIGLIGIDEDSRGWTVAAAAAVDLLYEYSTRAFLDPVPLTFDFIDVVVVVVVVAVVVVVVAPSSAAWIFIGRPLPDIC